MGDAELTAALEEATIDEVVDPVDAEAEVVEEEIEEIVEDVENLLPTDHKERSDLGRKVNALLKKTDKTDEVLLQLATAIERLTPKEEDPDDDTYVTKRELKEVVSQPSKDAKKYEKGFQEAFLKASEIDGLGEDEIEEIAQITIEKFNVPYTNDPKIDGAMNYAKAKEVYLSSKKKSIPGKRGTAPGVITKQTTKGTPAPKKKLDQASESLLNFIERMDGAETADKRRKAI